MKNILTNLASGLLGALIAIGANYWMAKNETRSQAYERFSDAVPGIGRFKNEELKEQRLDEAYASFYNALSVAANEEHELIIVWLFAETALFAKFDTPAAILQHLKKILPDHANREDFLDNLRIGEGQIKARNEFMLIR